MAEQSTLDIFATDLDVKDFVPKPTQVKFGGKPITVATGRGHQWDSLKTEIPNKKKLKLKKAQKKQVNATQNNWKLITTVGATNTKKQQAKTPVKFGMNRSNLKVVQGKAASIKLNLEKNNQMAAEQTNTPNVKEKKAEKVESPKPQQTDQQDSPQSSGIRGRMTASSFMNVDQPSTPKPNPVGYAKSFMRLPLQFQNNYPKGIPKSFLTQEHQQQLGTQPHTQPVANPQISNQQTAPPPNPEPVWEALPSKKTSSQPNWMSIKSRFDQMPTGQYANQLMSPTPTDQSYSPEQDFGPSGQDYGQQLCQSGPNAYEQTMFVETETKFEQKQQYSPSDAYADMSLPEVRDDLPDRSPDSHQSSSKRLSAFKRLGPVTQPKKPKLTINLMVGKEEAVREVVDESKESEDDKYTPVLERPDIQTSLDDTVMKFLTFWPWKKPLSVRRTLTARESKSMMHLELEQMEEQYEKDKCFFEILVTGYPKSWSKEDVLDAVLEAVKGKSLIPCFIEFTSTECKFLVIRSRPALVAIHKLGFTYRKDDVELKLSIMHVCLSVNQIDFIPRLVLRKRLSMSMEGETELNLKNFTLASDISHFLYFPLNRVANQSELMQLQSSVPWLSLTKLDLSHNRITSISGFDLATHTPRLKHLDLSHNYLDSVISLLTVRELPLTSIVLEGNPLCLDYIDNERYIKALKMMFPALKEIDGVKLTLPGDFPPYRRNYAPPGAEQIASKVLDTLFPLLDADVDERQLCEDLYMDDAVMTITFMYKLRYSAIYKDHRTLFARARILDEGEMDKIQGAVEIAKIMRRWPKLEHDPLTFTVDVLYHTDTTTILRVGGVMKVTTETLAEEEHLLHFTRTLVLHTLDCREYKITNEMIYWDLPDTELAQDAFRMTTGRSKILSFKLDGPPDAELREKLLEIFMKITDMGRKPSEKCLESKDWHLRNALEYFAKLLKLDNLDPLCD